jgi:hypothetical protein
VAGNPASPACGGSISQYQESPPAGGGVYCAAATVGVASTAKQAKMIALGFTEIPVSSPQQPNDAGRPGQANAQPERRENADQRLERALAGAVPLSENA